MMTGYGDVLESTNQQQVQHQTATTIDLISTNDCSKTHLVTNSTSAQSHSSPRGKATGGNMPSNPYASFQPMNVTTATVPPFNKLTDRPTVQSCEVDSPRSTVSKMSLPESNSEVVLGALRALLNKLKDLEQERDRARDEIEKLDKNRQWAAFSCNSDSRSIEKPMTYEAACNTNEDDWNYSNVLPDSLANQNFERDSRYVMRDSTLPFTPGLMSQAQSFTYPTTSGKFPYVRCSINSSMSIYQETTPEYGFNPNMISRTTNNYPVLTTGSRSGSFSSTGQLGSPGRLNSHITTGTAFTVDREPFASSTQNIEIPTRKAMAGQDIPNSAKSYSFSPAIQAPNGADRGLNGTVGNIGPNAESTSRVAITVPPLETYFEEDNDRSEVRSNLVGLPGTNEIVENSEIAKDIDAEKSFSELQNSTEAVEMQFRQAEDRCANLEMQLHSMQKLVDDHKKFSDAVNNKSSKAASKTRRTEKSNHAVTSHRSSSRPPSERGKSRRDGSSRRNSTSSLKVDLTQSEKMNRGSYKDDSELSSKCRHVSFQPADKKDARKVQQRSRSLDRSIPVAKASHTNCAHYHAKFSELPFVCGTSINQSHSVNVNLQRVLAALKMHSSACQSANVTGNLVNNMKPPSGKKVSSKLKKKNKKPTTPRPNSSCSVTSEESRFVTTAGRAKKCDFNSESSMQELVYDLYQEFEDLAIQYEDITLEREEKCEDQQLAVELSREQMILRKKMEAKQVQIDKIESHLDALREKQPKKANGATSGGRRRLKRNSGASKLNKTQGNIPKFDTSSELIKNMQKLQSSLRRDDLKWD